MQSKTQPGVLLDKVKLLAVSAVDHVFSFVVGSLRRILFGFRLLPANEDEIQRILIFRIGNVGDVAAAVPTLDAIRQRFPNAQISLLTSPGAAGAPGAKELLVPGSIVDSLIVYHKTDIATWTGRRRLVRRIREGRFDLFIELSNILAPFRQVLQSMLLARLAGCRYGIGFQVAPSRLFPRVQALRLRFQTESERLFNEVAPALKLKAIGSGRLPVSNGDRGVVRLLLERQGISTSDRVAVVHVGAKRRANRWFEGRFAAVADYTRLRYGIRTVLTGAPSERELMEDVRRRMKTRPVLLCGEVTLLQLAALMERATLYIGNDTGPMHIAAMMGTPAVAIFSARDFPSQWYPHGTGHIVLRKDVPCSPCFKDVCDQDLLCLDLIRLDEVLAAVDAQLAAADIPVAGSSKTSQGQFAILPVAGQPWDRSAR